MPEFHSLPEDINVHIHRPACPKCHTHMMLARIIPARMGFELHTFGCPKCDHVREVMIEADAFGTSVTPLQRRV